MCREVIATLPNTDWLTSFEVTAAYLNEGEFLEGVKIQQVHANNQAITSLYNGNGQLLCSIVCDFNTGRYVISNPLCAEELTLLVRYGFDEPQALEVQDEPSVFQLAQRQGFTGTEAQWDILVEAELA
jgi:hypothetical protein